MVACHRSRRLPPRLSGPRLQRDDFPTGTVFWDPGPIRRRHCSETNLFACFPALLVGAMVKGIHQQGADPFNLKRRLCLPLITRQQFAAR